MPGETITAKVKEQLDRKLSKSALKNHWNKLFLIVGVDGNATYQLIGAICHRGAHGTGHYVTHVRPGGPGSPWRCYNDAKCEESNGIETSAAYLVFYDKCVDGGSADDFSDDDDDDGEGQDIYPYGQHGPIVPNQDELDHAQQALEKCDPALLMVKSSYIARSTIRRRLLKVGNPGMRGEGGLECLCPGEWLNDGIINLYLNLIMEDARAKSPDCDAHFHVFSTQFYWCVNPSVQVARLETPVQYEAIRFSALGLRRSLGNVGGGPCASI